MSLLLLDQSVLEKVRGMGAATLERFEQRLHTMYLDAFKHDEAPPVEMPSTLMLQIIYGKPGDAVRAALVAGIVSQPQENRNV